MWTRIELKEKAKAVLRGNYWKALLISLVIAFATGGSGGSSGRAGRDNFSSNYPSYSGMGPDLIYLVILILVGVSVAIFFALAIRIFILSPLEVGGRRYFIQSAQYFDNKGCFRFAFNGQYYKGIVITMLLKGIFNFLWYLLFIIPGIVKYYSYSMVPYILADNPNIGASKAIQLSKDMTAGHKWDMFVLDLSFLGWYILGAIAFGIGIIFVLPYDYATKAELYLVLRQNALRQGMCSLNDLMLYDPLQEEYNV